MDDIRLVELAADRPEELFPMLHRAAAFRPLLFVLCTLPGLYALVHGVCDESDALWGLRTVPLLNASTIEEFVDPVPAGPEEALKWQPLLGNWSTALVLRAAGTSSPAGFHLVPYLSTMFLVAMCYALFSRISGARAAFWTVLLAAFHGPILTTASSNAPYALAVALAMGTFWGFLGHLKRGDQAVSMELLVGGVALGLCTLAGGPLAMAVVLILLLHVLGLQGEKSTAKRGKGTGKRRVWVGWPALKSLAVCCLTAFAVGGWWVLMMRYNYGGVFWNGWLAGGLHTELSLTQTELLPPSENFLERLAHQFVGITGLLLGAVVLGICYAIRELIFQEDEKRRRQWQFLIAWWGCALVMFLSSVRSAQASSVSGSMWQLFLLAASVGAAGMALDEISYRRIRLETVVGLTLMTLCVGYLWSQRESNEVLPETLGLLLWIASGVTLIWGAHKLCHGQERRQHFVLATLVVALLIGNAAVGAWSVRQATDDDHTLDAFRQKLSSEQKVDRCLLLTDTDPPLRIQYALRSLRPELPLEIMRLGKGTGANPIWDRREFSGSSSPLVVEWTENETRAESLSAEEELRTISIVNPQYYERRILRAYRLEWVRTE